MWGQTYHGPSTRPPIDARRPRGRLARATPAAATRAAALARRASPRPSPKNSGGAARPERAVRRRARLAPAPPGPRAGSPRWDRRRERCRDRFLDLLRDYEAARRDANRERLFPPADDAFFFRKRRRRAAARCKQETRRDRASQVAGPCRPSTSAGSRAFSRISSSAAAAAGMSMTRRTTRSGRARLWKRCRASSGSSRSSSSAPTRRPSPILYGRCSSPRRLSRGRRRGRAPADARRRGAGEAHGRRGAARLPAVGAEL